jgi:hypothetical protein
MIVACIFGHNISFTDKSLGARKLDWTCGLLWLPGWKFHELTRFKRCSWWVYVGMTNRLDILLSLQRPVCRWQVLECWTLGGRTVYSFKIVFNIH